MITRTLTLLFILLSVIGTSFSQSADTVFISLPTSITRALEISPEVSQMETRKDFAQARQDEATGSRFLPRFNLTTAHSLVPGLTSSTFPDDELYLDPDLRNDRSKLAPYNVATVELVQPIYTAGELSGSIDAARNGVLLADADIQSKTLEVTHRTAKLYFSVLLANQLYDLTDDAGKILSRASIEIERLLDEGASDVDDADLFQVQIVEQEYKQGVTEVTESKLLAYSALRRQLLLPEETFLSLASRELKPLSMPADSLPVLFTLGLQHRTELIQVEAGLAAREGLLTAARSNYFPKVFFGVQGSLGYAAGRPNQPNPYITGGLNQNSIAVGFTIRQNLSFGITRSKVRQAEAERNEVRHLGVAAEQLVLFDIESAWRNLRTAKAKLDAQKESLHISKEWLRTEEINFDLDLGDTENLVRAVRSNLELKIKYFQAVYNYNIAVLDLGLATGTLTDQVGNGTLVEN